ncbi:MAG: RNA polymerase sporulation sigma factor SigK [Bacilli bacterium]|nr:RNA polymerase sporulation sigma factor SigK [Bacilli bacterium]
MLFFTGSYSNHVFPEPLSKEDEEYYVNKMLQQDKEARNILIERNLRLVAHIVKKFETKNIDTDDLISIGTIGLIKGIDTYKENKSTKITTYAARCIQNEILMYFRSNKKNQNNVSINDSIGYDKEGNEINLIDVLQSEDKEDFADSIHKEHNIELLKQYLGILSKREKEIIIKRYGLCMQNEKTQKEIAKEMGISRSYVSRIEKRALTKMLREYLKNNQEI